MRVQLTCTPLNVVCTFQGVILLWNYNLLQCSFTAVTSGGHATDYDWRPKSDSRWLMFASASVTGHSLHWNVQRYAIHICVQCHCHVKYTDFLFLPIWLVKQFCYCSTRTGNLSSEQLAQNSHFLRRTTICGQLGRVTTVSCRCEWAFSCVNCLSLTLGAQYFVVRNSKGSRLESWASR